MTRSFRGAKYTARAVVRACGTFRSLRRHSISLAALLSVAMLIGQPASASLSAATTVSGSAFGYHADNIALFGGAQPDTGPEPSVSLAADGSNSPQVDAAETGLVQYGPATLFSSDAIVVESAVTPLQSVTSSAAIQNVNQAATQVTVTGSEIFTARSVLSTCSASASGTSRSTTILDGSLYLDSGWDDGDAVYPEPAESAGGLAEHDPVVVPIATNPAPGTSHSGHIHLNATSQDDYLVVFNEQPGGSTVNAVHEYFGTAAPDVLTGDMVLAHAACGISAG